MAFVLGEIESVDRVIKFEQPASAGKPKRKVDFVATFKVHPHEVVQERRRELAEYMEGIRKERERARKDPEYQPQFSDRNFDDEMLLEDIINLKGVMSTDGSELEFSADLLARVLQDRPARQALLDEWIAINSDDAIKRKN